jgi:DNA (cytosine-5)-methyltransferase 1
MYRLLDAFCGGGGAGMGYSRAGFDVVGIDIKPQPHYPFEFIQADALEYIAQHGTEFDAIHASPPCQAYTKAGRQWRGSGKEYADLIDATRKALQETSKPYVIENVPGAPLIDSILLNGAMFGMLIHRDRYFETSFDIPFFLLPSAMRPVKMGRPINPGDVIQPVGHFSNVAYARKQMGIDWMSQRELSQAIPPAYTEYIGAHLMRVIEAQRGPA